MASGQSGRHSVPTTRTRTLTDSSWVRAALGASWMPLLWRARGCMQRNAVRQATLGGVSLTLTAAPDRIAAATTFLHVTDERGQPSCGPAPRDGEVEGDSGSARAPPKRVDFGREQVPRQNGRNDLCTYAGPCPTRLVTGLDHVGGLWCGPYRARMSVHLQRSLGLAALWRARAPPRPTRDPKPTHR